MMTKNVSKEKKLKLSMKNIKFNEVSIAGYFMIEKIQRSYVTWVLCSTTNFLTVTGCLKVQFISDTNYLESVSNSESKASP